MIGITQTINRYSIANLSLIDSGNLNNFKTIYDYKISTS